MLEVAHVAKSVAVTAKKTSPKIPEQKRKKSVGKTMVVPGLKPVTLPLVVSSTT
ncbi:MAG: hypothetical protein IT581_18955 [Verrucomicrobiales bacterium]|nr:hypothetical protein [Verrucomicrobiales bacterium]